MTTLPGLYYFDGTVVRLIRQTTAPRFVSGVTEPVYVPTANFDGYKNVGNTDEPLTPYPGAVQGGVTTLAGGVYSNYDFGNTVLDLRGSGVINNCRAVTTDYLAADTIGSIVRVLNGASTTSWVINDSEFHNRTQRIMAAGFMGRNTIINRTVFTGCVDGVNLSTSGSAPLTSGVMFNDSWAGDLAWWYYPTAGVVHSGDVATHNDCMSVTAVIAGGVGGANSVLVASASDFVGTGTPGCGSDAGNPFAATYVTTQAQMEGWRTTFLNLRTQADQSYGGVPRKLSTVGSWACVMVNRAGATFTDFVFAGGTVQVNAVDVNLSGQSGLSIKRAKCWNDMSGGHSLTGTAKGTAIYARTDFTTDIPTTGADQNLWFDGTTVTPTLV